MNAKTRSRMIRTAVRALAVLSTLVIRQWGKVDKIACFAVDGCGKCAKNPTIVGMPKQNAFALALLLEGIAPDQLPAALMKKLMRWDLVNLLDVIPHNLGVFLR